MLHWLVQALSFPHHQSLNLAWPLVAEQSAWEPAYDSKGKPHWERCGLLSPQELQRRGLWRAVQEYHQVTPFLQGVSVLAAE